MTPEYFEEIIRNKKFDRSLQGYNPSQVDRYLQKITTYYWNVCNEKKELEKKINQYEKQDTHLRKALIRVEEVSGKIEEQASMEAKKIRQQAKDEAELIRMEAIKNAELIKNKAIEEAEKYTQSLILNQKTYDDQTRKLIGNLYFIVRNKINRLQDELLNELEEYNKEMKFIVQNDHAIKEIDAEPKKQKRTSLDKWKLKEEELLVGYVIREDIKDEIGTVVIPKAAIVTPEIINNLVEKGLYGELLTAIGNEVNEYCK